MTEAYEDEWVVRVRAQVMCRDEATGGWVALGGGGLANVCVGRRLPPPHVAATTGSDAHLQSSSGSPLHADNACPRNYEYFIYGKRISDQSVVLSCTIKKDFQYNKVMPTFHHWVTEEKRFGLTFQTAADARAFDRGVRNAIQELLHGLGGTLPALCYKNLPAAPRDEDDDSNIFECLNLPSDSHSSSENSTASRSQHRRADMSLVSKELVLKQKLAGSCSEEPDKMGGFIGDPLDADNYSYVQLTAMHEYTYPQLGTGGIMDTEKSPPNTKPPLAKRDSGSSLKKRGAACYATAASRPPPPLPAKKGPLAKPGLAEGPFHSRLKCRHCHEWYLERANRAGACEFAPDCLRTCIDAVSCIKCAQCMLYHCMSDAEGEFATHPCDCSTVEEGCTKRWIGLALLSLLVPCLWCYPPLRGVHWCCVSCGAAGGRHAPAQ